MRSMGGAVVTADMEAVERRLAAEQTQSKTVSKTQADSVTV